MIIQNKKLEQAHDKRLHMHASDKIGRSVEIMNHFSLSDDVIVCIFSCLAVLACAYVHAAPLISQM